MVLAEEMANAAASNNIAKVIRLLDAGHDVNSQNENGETAFSYACANNALEVAKLLHSRGALLNTIDRGGGSPLDWAVCWSSHEFRAWLHGVGGVRHDDTYSEQPWPRTCAKRST